MIVQCLTCGKHVESDGCPCPHCGAYVPKGAGFEFGKVVSGGLAIFFKNIPQFGLLGVLVLLPLLLLQWTVFDPLGGPAEIVRLIQYGSWRLFLYLLAYFVLICLLVGAVAHGTAQAHRGRPVSVGDCLSTGLGRLFPVAGVSLVLGLAIILIIGLSALVMAAAPVVGVIFMIVGAVFGVMIYIRYWIAVPAIVVEQDGVFAALGRSAELTRDCRWKIVGILLVFWILLFIVQMGVQLVVGVAPTLGSTAVPMGPIGRVVLFVIDALGYSCGAVLCCVCYFELRRVKEGVDIEQVAAVFD